MKSFGPIIYNDILAKQYYSYCHRCEFLESKKDLVAYIDPSTGMFVILCIECRTEEKFKETLGIWHQRFDLFDDYHVY